MQLARITLGVGVVGVASGIGRLAVEFSAEDQMAAAVAVTAMGVLLIGWSVMAMNFARVTKPADDAYHLGQQIGYDSGYLEGRASARPVVVPMASPSTCLECDNRKRGEDLAGGTDVIHPEAGVR